MRKMQTERTDVNRQVIYNRLPDHEERMRAHCARVQKEYHNQPIKTGVAILKQPNKRRQRTEALRQAIARRRMAEQANNAIEEQHRFNNLVKQGVIVEAKQ